MNKSMLTVKETAKALGVCEMTIYRMVNNKRIPHQRIGTKIIRIPKSYVDDKTKNPINEVQKFIFG